MLFCRFALRALLLIVSFALSLTCKPGLMRVGFYWKSYLCAGNGVY